jgi:DNA (cytosine-5)-methyltransferase 1
MRTLTIDTENTSVVEEPQLAVKFYNKEKKEKQKGKTTLNMLSLFSGCGGMDLGFEGDFSVLKSSINEILNPSFINEELENNFVNLSKTRFRQFLQTTF